MSSHSGYERMKTEMPKARGKTSKRTKPSLRFTRCVVKVDYLLFLRERQGEQSMSFVVDLEEKPHTRIASIEKMALKELASSSRLYREFGGGIKRITIRMIEPTEALKRS